MNTLGLEQGFQVLALEQDLMLHSPHSQGCVSSCLLGIQYSVLGFLKKKQLNSVIKWVLAHQVPLENDVILLDM